MLKTLRNQVGDPRSWLQKLSITQAKKPNHPSNTHFDFDVEFWPLYETCKAFTMTPTERMYALWNAVKYVTRNKIPGDFVECGVWRGGSTMMAALTFLAEGDASRRLWLYDTFEGMDPPTDKDVELRSGRSAQSLLKEQERIPARNVWAMATLDDVQANLQSTGYPSQNLVYRKGLVQDTLQESLPSDIAILRLDTDWYELTLIELQKLWPLLSKSGVMIIDDYGWWKGQRQAVDEFFKAMPFKPFFSRIDVGMVLAIKQ